MYSFEKDDVSFSEIIRIEKGKNLLSKYPHSNSWLEEEAFYGMDELRVECRQTISSYERKEMIFKITNKEYPMVQDFILNHSHCSDFSYTFKKDLLCVECTCKEKLILSRKDCE